MRHQNQGRKLDAKLRGQGRGGSQQQGQQMEIEEKMKEAKGSKSMLVPVVTSNKGLLWRLGKGQRKRQ